MSHAQISHDEAMQLLNMADGAEGVAAGWELKGGLAADIALLRRLAEQALDGRT